jgi:uncharacterized protein
MSEPNQPEATPVAIPPPLPGMTESPTLPAQGPWGFWPTVGWGAVVASVYVAVQSVVVVGYVIAYVVAHGGKSAPSAEAIGKSGLVMGAALVLSAPAVVALCLVFVRMRKSLTVQEYLGLSWPSTRSTLGWTAGLLLLVAATDLLTVALGRPVVPEVMEEIYRNAGFKPLIWVGMILAAPVAEECFFRGFLFRGWGASRLGGFGTIVLTSALWAGTHVQYDIFGIALIFLYGIVLGGVRLRTGSLLLCVVLHALMNLIATVEVEMLQLKS